MVGVMAGITAARLEADAGQARERAARCGRAWNCPHTGGWRLPRLWPKIGVQELETQIWVQERNLGSNLKNLGIGIHLSEQLFGRFGSF
jgi:hypothetical protein